MLTTAKHHLPSLLKSTHVVYIFNHGSIQDVSEAEPSEDVADQLFVFFSFLELPKFAVDFRVVIQMLSEGCASLVRLNTDN